MVLAELLQENKFSHIIDADLVGPVAKEAKKLKDKGSYVVGFYDPSLPQLYRKPELDGPAYTVRAIPSLDLGKVEGQLNELYAAAIPSIIVLPDSVWEKVQEYIKSRTEKIENRGVFSIVPIELKSRDFIKAIVKAYSNGCEGLDSVAERIEKCETGYTLLSAYAGRALRDNCAAISNVEKILETAKGDTKQFIKYYICFFLLENREEKWRSFAFSLLCRVWFGDMTESLAKDLPEIVYEGHLDSKIASWICSKREDIVEESLREVIEDSLRICSMNSSSTPLAKMCKTFAEVNSRVLLQSKNVQRTENQNSEEFDEEKQIVLEHLVQFISKLKGNSNDDCVEDLALLYATYSTQTMDLYRELSNHSSIEKYLGDKWPLPRMTIRLFTVDVPGSVPEPLNELISEMKRPIPNPFQLLTSNKGELFAEKLKHWCKQNKALGLQVLESLFPI